MVQGARAAIAAGLPVLGVERHELDAVRRPGHRHRTAAAAAIGEPELLVIERRRHRRRAGQLVREHGAAASSEPVRGVARYGVGRWIRPPIGDDMITLYGFGNIFPEGRGETKDLRAQWALEETGLPYRVHALDHAGGELDGDAYSRISPFHQVPVIDDDGFVVAESAAVVLYLAEKAGKLIPSDVQGRTRVVQWCFAAVSTVDPTFMCLDVIEIFDQDAHKLKTEVRKLAGRWLKDVERRLEDREWIACADFTVADIMMACVLRGIRKTDLMDPFPRIKAYYERCLARPAWQRTLSLYAERLGVSVDDIR